jgi:toxin-antitoxin system PIN domain toxin
MTPDVNVLIAASRADHPHHEPARTWLESALDACGHGRSLAILPMVASGFLRLVTHPRVFVQPTPVESAAAFLRAVLQSPGVDVPPLGREWPVLLELCERHRLTGNDVPDAWIAAAVEANHGHLVSFDKGFRRLLKATYLTVLQP